MERDNVHIAQDELSADSQSGQNLMDSTWQAQ